MLLGMLEVRELGTGEDLRIRFVKAFHCCAIGD